MRSLRLVHSWRMAPPSGSNYRRFLWIFILLIVISAVGSLVGLPLYLTKRVKPSSTDSTRHPSVYNYPSSPIIPHNIGKLIQDLYGDCGGDDPDTREEMQKDVIALLKEQMELTKAVMEESLQRKVAQVKDVRNSAEPYRREADKCRVSMMTCEAAREMDEAEFVLEKKRTAEWERHARERGWMDPSRVYI